MNCRYTWLFSLSQFFSVLIVFLTFFFLSLSLESFHLADRNKVRIFVK